MDSVKLERGWLERQCQKAAEDVRQWPEWMKDAAMREREKENRRHARIAENHERRCVMSDGWVRVEERLPEPGKNCWVVGKDRAVFIAQLAYMTNIGWVIPGPEFRAAGKVTHWQPLVKPAPPPEESKHG